MVKVIDMQDMRYLNLFRKITGIDTSKCFTYSSSLVFVVPKNFLAIALGKEGENLKKIGQITGKRIKIVGDINGSKRIENFIISLVRPIIVEKVEDNEGEVVISAGRESRAMLIGRNKIKLEELKKIIKDNFNKSVRISD